MASSYAPRDAAGDTIAEARPPTGRATVSHHAISTRKSALERDSERGGDSALARERERARMGAYASLEDQRTDRLTRVVI